MALVASGAIALSDVNVELGFSSTATIALNDAAVRTLFAISSGAISMSDGYSKAATLGYVEDVFSTYNYTGTGAALTITNNINLSSSGGLVWTKARYYGISHRLVDTARGPYYELVSNDTSASSYNSQGLTSFGTTGYSIDAGGGYNNSGGTYVSWTFRKSPKFFDIVTFTQSTSGAQYQTINHNLGSVPGFVVIKGTNTSSIWVVYHRSIPNYGLALNQTWGTSVVGAASLINVTSSSFDFDINNWGAPAGSAMIAYVFAHNAGGFGATGTDNVISCGSFTTDGGGDFSPISLGYEPQWILLKNATTSLGFTDWRILDSMRGFTTNNDSYLAPNTAAAEGSIGMLNPTATGFMQDPASAIRESTTYIYMAIRRGPMKVPTVGTSVYKSIVRAGTNASAVITGAGFPPDFILSNAYVGGNSNFIWDKVRGKFYYSRTVNKTIDYEGNGDGLLDFYPDGFFVGADAAYAINGSHSTYSYHLLRRTPKVFDMVSYEGQSGVQNVTHNLQVVPELIITRNRNQANQDWAVQTLGNAGNNLWLDQDLAYFGDSSRLWGSTNPTSSVFTVSNGRNEVNTSGALFMAYLFATLAGVSKVGTYTGTGSLLTVNCGFTSGARFVLIKRTDSSGSWYVFDSNNGIGSGNDRYFMLNAASQGVNASPNANVTNEDNVDTDSTGFKVTASSPAGLNVSGGTYFFLAIA